MYSVFIAPVYLCMCLFTYHHTQCDRIIVTWATQQCSSTDMPRSCNGLLYIFIWGRRQGLVFLVGGIIAGATSPATHCIESQIVCSLTLLYH